MFISDDELVERVEEELCFGVDLFVDHEQACRIRVLLLQLILLSRGCNDDWLVLDKNKFVDLVPNLGWNRGEFGHCRELKLICSVQRWSCSRWRRECRDREST